MNYFVLYELSQSRTCVKKKEKSSESLKVENGETNCQTSGLYLYFLRWKNISKNFLSLLFFCFLSTYRHVWKNALFSFYFFFFERCWHSFRNDHQEFQRESNRDAIFSFHFDDHRNFPIRLGGRRNNFLFFQEISSTPITWSYRFVNDTRYHLCHILFFFCPVTGATGSIFSCLYTEIYLINAPINHLTRHLNFKCF